jgi:general secretion pathway protein E
VSAQSVGTQELLTAIRRARQELRAGGEAVLDALLRSARDPDALAEQLRLAAGVVIYAEADGIEPDFGRWDLSAARRHRCVVLRDCEGRVYAAAEDPWDEALLQQIARGLGVQPLAMAARRSQIERWLDHAVVPAVASGAVALAKADGPIVRFVDDAVASAAKALASDVHFECDREGITVKHRLDGVLVRHSRLSGELLAQEVISRIKVLAKLDITERRMPQDGRFRQAIGDMETDVRVSIIPSVHGEDAVLRLLDKTQLRGAQTSVNLDGLGFDVRSKLLIRELARKPSGLLLVTGPTGSGKTTTVYAALSEINTGIEKIVTIEDPVEYELQGVLQVPVNERKGLTFAKGLRAILRHDPDRILVGEIRDAETASIAVQSALTGHLVFTTVHANSVADVVGRFRHFDIDMFGFMSALNGVVVQRLLRRACPRCAKRRPPTPDEAVWLLSIQDTDDNATVADASGCSHCRGTGYRGRFVVAELHRISDQMRDDVTEGAPLSHIKAHAATNGVVPLERQAYGHVLAGDTTVQEVRRVIG